jgi:hypothetical protein
MKEEEEKREEAEVDKLEETEYEDTLEDSNLEAINPSSANDVEVNYENGSVAVESGKETEEEDTPSGNDVDGNEETPENKTHLPADAPWLSRMFEGNTSGPTDQCVGASACMPPSPPFLNQFFQCLPRFGLSVSLHLGDPQRTWPSLGTDSWTRATGWTRSPSLSCSPLGRASPAQRRRSSSSLLRCLGRVRLVEF